MKKDIYSLIINEIYRKGEEAIDELSYNAYYLLDMTDSQIEKIAKIMLELGYKYNGEKIYFKNGISISYILH